MPQRSGLPFQRQRGLKKWGQARQELDVRDKTHLTGPRIGSVVQYSSSVDKLTRTDDCEIKVVKPPGVSPADRELIQCQDKIKVITPEGEIEMTVKTPGVTDGDLKTGENSKSGRPWSKKKTKFSNSSTLSFGKVLLLLGLLPLSLLHLADHLELKFDSPASDSCWQLLNSRHNLPRGFFEVHNNLDLVDRSDDRLLPRWPVSPGPFATTPNNTLLRPE